MRLRRTGWAPPPKSPLAFLLLCAAATCQAQNPPAEKQPSAVVAEKQPLNVLLITVDTLRPDALGWVAGNNATPALDALAREGFRFPAAVSPTPITQPAHASVFTGLVPRRHGLRDNGQVLAPGPVTLAERLRQHGWSTAAVVSGYPLAAEFGLDRGFDHYDDDLASGSPGRLERPAAETTAAALEWLGEARELPALRGGSGETQPWFLWVHYWDPHDPYTPPPTFARPGPRGAYDGEVAYVDDAIGKLRRGLSGVRGRLLTVFAADHGESLGEHGEETHGFFIYESTVAVPLVFHLPGRVVARQSGAPARLVDIGPTILDLLGLPPLASDVDGVSLVGMITGEPREVPTLRGGSGEMSLRGGSGEMLPALRGGSGEMSLRGGSGEMSLRGGSGEMSLRGRSGETRPPAYIETRRPWLSYGWSPLKAVRQGSWKLIAAPRPELYDLESDPGEAHNLVDRERQKARQLAALLRQAEQRPAASSETLDDPEAMARLRSLGYVGAGSDPGEPPAGLADPKDRLDLWNALSEALALLEQHRYAEAVARFDAVLEQDPDNPFALSRSGAALLEAGDPAAAVRRLRRAVPSNPGDFETRTTLARALTAAGNYPEAAAEWLEVVRLRPESADAWAQLAIVLGRSGKGEKATGALTRAVELAPDRSNLRVQLSFVHNAGGEPAKALEHLRIAAESAGPEKFAYASSLGLLLLRQGQKDEARVWLARSRPGEGDYAEARFELARLEAAAGDSDAARAELRRALEAAPTLRQRAASDPVLSGLL